MLNANYLLSLVKRRLSGAARRPLHARVRGVGAALAKERGIRAMDIAKRLIDFGFHAPTVYFPLIVPEAMMIEPTETESRETLDAFAEVLLADRRRKTRRCSTTPRTPRRSAGPTRSRPPRRRCSRGSPRSTRAGRQYSLGARGKVFVPRSSSVPVSPQTLYDEDAVVPPRPVQLVWKNWPRGRSTRS